MVRSESVGSGLWIPYGPGAEAVAVSEGPCECRARALSQPAGASGPATVEVKLLDADSSEGAERRCNSVREGTFYPHEPGIPE